MPDVTRILSRVEEDDANAADELLPLVYDELRKLARAKLSHEKPGQTLQATALVHEAFLRLVGAEQSQLWDSRGHFFAAAAEAMRRILVDSARRKSSHKRGGDLLQVDLEEEKLAAQDRDDNTLAVDEALQEFSLTDPQAADLVKLRYYCGFSITEAAQLLGISRTTAYQQWSYARAWLRVAVTGVQE